MSSPQLSFPRCLFSTRCFPPIVMPLTGAEIPPVRSTCRTALTKSAVVALSAHLNTRELGHDLSPRLL